MKLLQLLVAGVSALGPDRFDGDKVVRFDTSQDSHRSLVNALLQDYNEVIVWKDSLDHIDVQIPRRLLKKVERAIRVPHKTLIENVQERIDAEQPNNQRTLGQQDFFTAYHSAEEYIEFMGNLGNATVFSIGTTFENRDIPGIKIGSGKIPVVINGGIHAREWISPSTVAYFANFLASPDNRAWDLLSKFTFHLIPVLNPDGYEYTRTNNRLLIINLECGERIASLIQELVAQEQISTETLSSNGQETEVFHY